MALAELRHTLEQYLEIERNSETKHEFFNGRIFAMAGASPEHVIIGGNVTIELGTQLKGKPCKIYPGELRVKIDPIGLYTYPDHSVVCGQPEFEDTKPKTLLNPTLIIEILSESTEAYDRGEKFTHYRKLESLREFVMIAQDKFHIEVYRRVGDQWILTEYSNSDEPVPLESIGASLTFPNVYYNVDFPPEPAPPVTPHFAER